MFVLKKWKITSLLRHCWFVLVFSFSFLFLFCFVLYSFIYFITLQTFRYLFADILMSTNNSIPWGIISQLICYCDYTETFFLKRGYCQISFWDISMLSKMIFLSLLKCNRHHYSITLVLLSSLDQYLSVIVIITALL